MSTPAPLAVLPMAILPAPGGDSRAPTSPSPSPNAPPADTLRLAETLGIPWKRILLEEIEAEQKLRRYMPDLDRHCSLRSALAILSFSLLHSWRLRDRIESLACEARGASIGGAIRQLRMVFQHLIGRGERDQPALARHFWFAYERVLLLQRVRRIAAAHTDGSLAERLALICTRASCSFDDAAWAAGQEAPEGRGRRLEVAIRKVREEGFLIPRAETEARSFAQLRRIVLTSPHLARPRRSRLRHRDSVAAPRRVQLPVDTR